MRSANLWILLIFLTLPFFCWAEAQKVQIDTSTSETTSPRPDKITVPTAAEDAIITKSIEAHIKKSATLSKVKVNIKTRQGVVVISGIVDSDSNASNLVELAQSIVGVRDVDTSNLKVPSSSQPFTDAMITAKIKGLLIREDLFGSKDVPSINVSVETKEGVVYLTGAIENQDQIKNVIALISGMQGVKRVEYHVKEVVIQPTPQPKTTPQTNQ